MHLFYFVAHLLMSRLILTLQRHSPEVLLQSLWKPLLVSQLHGPHTVLPHQP